MEMVIVSFEGGMEGVCNILKKKFRGEHGPRDRDGDEPPRKSQRHARSARLHAAWTAARPFLDGAAHFGRQVAR